MAAEGAAALRERLARDPAFARKPQAIVGAAQAADRAALERCLARGADVNAKWRNYRPLHALMQESPHAEGRADPERLACLDWLLEHGADPDGLGAWPSTRAILIAAFVGVPEYVERLRRGGARIDLFVHAALGEVAAVEKALERDPGAARAPDESGLTALAACAGSRLGRRDAKVAKNLRTVAARLLDANADPNARVRSWAHDVDVAYFAIGSRQVELLELLLERGADASAALVSAAWKEEDVYVELALRHGARPDGALQEGRPILNELVRWGQVAPALRLLAHGASPNVPDGRGWTALHQAASRGNERLFRALLERGGDAGARGAAGETPLDVARGKGRAKLVALAAGAPAPPAPSAPKGRRKA